MAARLSGRDGQADQRLREQVAPALREVTGPDDPAVAAVLLVASTATITLNAISLLAIIATTVVISVVPRVTGAATVIALVVLVACQAALLRMPACCLAVTRQQAVGLRTSRFGHRPRGVAFVAPLSATAVRIGWGTPLGAAVRVTTAGQRQPTMRAGRVTELAGLVRALRDGGASVTGSGAAGQLTRLL